MRSNNYELIIFTPRGDLHDQWAQTREDRFIEVGWGLPRCSHRFQGVLGAKVDDTREGCLSRCCEALDYMAAKVLRVGPARRSLVPSLQWAVVPFRGM
jgi:hypothetical protein